MYVRLDSRSSLDDILGSLRLILGKVLTEELAQLDDLSIEALGTGSPSRLGVQKLIRNAGAGLGDLEVEHLVVLKLDVGELARVDGIQDATSVLERATLAALSVASTDPAGVEEPGVGLVLINLVCKHLGVAHGVQGKEGLGEAAGEGGLGLSDTVFRASHLGGVAGDEVEHGLGAVQLGDGREDTTGITGQENDVGRHVLRQARNLGVGNILDGVSASSVLSQRTVVVVDLTSLGVEDDVLENGAIADSVEDIGLLLGGQTNGLCVAATLDVEDTTVTPAVLVVTDESTVGVRREGGLAGAGQTEEDGDITVLALIGGRVQGQDVVLDRHLVVEDGEDTLLHLTGILGTQDDHLLGGEVDRDRGSRGHTLCEAVGRERTGIVDGVVGVEVLELLTSRADEHVPHEEGMIGTGADDANAYPVLLIPASVSIDDVDAVAGVEVVDSTLTVDLPDLCDE